MKRRKGGNLKLVNSSYKDSSWRSRLKSLFVLLVGFKDPSYPIRQKTELYTVYRMQRELRIPSVISLNSLFEGLKKGWAQEKQEQPSPQ